MHSLTADESNSVQDRYFRRRWQQGLWGIGWGGVLAVGLSGCGDTPPDSARTMREGIVGGELAGERFESVLWLENGCNATLIHEQAIAYAAHCGTEHRRAWVADEFDLRVSDEGELQTDMSGARGSIAIESCVAHDDGGAGSTADIAICVLAEPVAWIPAILPLDGCERGALSVGADVTLVGFGYDDALGGEAGVKRLTQATVVETDPRLLIGNEAHGTCKGDSGGPALIRVPSAEGAEEDEWRLAGVLSSGEPETCGVGLYVEVPDFVPWLTAQSGLRISPCFDSNGSWSPTSKCVVPNLDGEGATVDEGGRHATTCGPPFSPQKSSSTGCAVAMKTAPGGSVVCWLLLLVVARVRRKKKAIRA